MSSASAAAAMVAATPLQRHKCQGGQGHQDKCSAPPAVLAAAAARTPATAATTAATAVVAGVTGTGASFSLLCLPRRGDFGLTGICHVQNLHSIAAWLRAAQAGPRATDSKVSFITAGEPRRHRPRSRPVAFFDASVPHPSRCWRHRGWLVGRLRQDFRGRRCRAGIRLREIPSAQVGHRLPISPSINGLIRFQSLDIAYVTWKPSSVRCSLPSLSIVTFTCWKSNRSGLRVDSRPMGS